MDNNFIEYLQQLELMAFFSGYPLVYAVTLFIFQNRRSKTFTKNVVPHLPYAYALVGTLYLGLQLKTLYPDYSVDKIVLTIQTSYLVTWGLLSILFWIPAFAKKTVFSLLHSLVFFFILVRDLFLQSGVSHQNGIVRNDMNVYTISLILNMGSLALVVLLSYLFFRNKTHLRT